jgi:hypothetical protein
MITKEKILAVFAAAVLGLGLFSCTLEPTVDSPSGRVVALPEGIPDGLTVSEPRITYDGTTTILTYIVSVSAWPAGGLPYKAQAAASSLDGGVPPEPLSVEALILRYGALFSGDPEDPLPAVEEGDYPLKPVTPVGGGKALPCVIVPLDTSFIRDYLKKKLMISVTEDIAEEEVEVPLVWIEENPAIGLIETVDTEDGANWKDGVYEDDGIRIGGFYEGEENGETVYNISTIENFDDGKEGRTRSIATVLADGTDRNKQRYTSTINFYADAADAKAREIKESAPTESNDSGGAAYSAKTLKTWMGSNKPVLRVVYQWAD